MSDSLVRLFKFERHAPNFYAPLAPIWLSLFIFPVKIWDYTSFKVIEYKNYARPDKNYEFINKNNMKIQKKIIKLNY